MSDPFVAEIRIFPFNFAPRGWAWCDGQLLPISQNTALFSLLGTNYGGDGRSNFALPNLQGSAPLMPGQGPGLALRTLGEQGGSDTVTLLQSEIPAHTHAVTATLDQADNNQPVAGTSLGVPVGFPLYASSADTALAADVLPPAGADAPHNNMQPYLTFYFCIAMQGVFPPRS